MITSSELPVSAIYKLPAWYLVQGSCFVYYTLFPVNSQYGTRVRTSNSVSHGSKTKVLEEVLMTRPNPSSCWILFSPCTYIIHHFSGAPRGAFQQPVYNKYKVRWLRVLARPLQAVHNVFLPETLSCALR